MRVRWPLRKNNRKIGKATRTVMVVALMIANRVTYSPIKEAFPWHITAMANSADDDAIMRWVTTVTASGLDALGRREVGRAVRYG